MSQYFQALTIIVRKNASLGTLFRRLKLQHGHVGPPSVQVCGNCMEQVRRASFWGSSKVTEWKKAVSEAEKIVGYPTSFMSLRCLLSDELSNVAMQMRKMVGTKHPLLKTARKFFYDGKHSMQTRGLLVLLMSKAAGPAIANGDLADSMVSGIYQSQRNLAEITEMINTANLIHKGVVNLASLQAADGPIQDMHFGNKMAVLSGDFLLANASTGLAELENTHVVEIISSAIGDMMEADFTKLKDDEGNAMLPSGGTSVDDWRHQTFLASGSLIAKSCKAAMMLADHNESIQDSAFEFGKQIAYVHQLNEDLQPILRPTDDTNGLNMASAPMILYSQEHLAELSSLGLLDNSAVDTIRILKLLKGTNAIEETQELCKYHGTLALNALEHFVPSDAKLALENMVKAVTNV